MTLVTKCRSPRAREPAKHQPHPSHCSSSDFKLKRREVFCYDTLTSWLETAFSSIYFVQRKNAFSSSNSQPLSCCRCVTKDTASLAAGETDDKETENKETDNTSCLERNLLLQKPGLLSASAADLKCGHKAAPFPPAHNVTETCELNQI